VCNLKITSLLIAFDRSLAILVVDDELLNCMVIKSFLSDDYEVATVNNGQECLRSLSDRLPTLIITDIDMPVLSGLEACKQLRADDRFMHIPVIFMSTMSTPDVRYKCTKAGDDYLKIMDNKLNLNGVEKIVPEVSCVYQNSLN